MKLRSFARAHKILLVCVLVGCIGGVYGLLAGLGSGWFVELVVNRIREERTNPQSEADATQDEKIVPFNDEMRAAYHTLGLLSDASFEEVKAAHRQLAVQFHPDSPAGDKEQFVKIQQAYELLLNFYTFDVRAKSL